METYMGKLYINSHNLMETPWRIYCYRPYRDNTKRYTLVHAFYVFLWNLKSWCSLSVWLTRSSHVGHISPEAVDRSLTMWWQTGTLSLQLPSVWARWQHCHHPAKGIPAISTVSKCTYLCIYTCTALNYRRSGNFRVVKFSGVLFSCNKFFVVWAYRRNIFNW